ncbi:MAG: DciA family protein [Pseudomonadota bacterium]
MRSHRSPLPQYGRTRPVQQSSAKALRDLTPNVLEPVIGKRVGMHTNLRLAWPEVVGEDVAGCTEPLRIDWPRRAGDDEPFRPGTLVVACEPMRALFIEADSTVLRGRINVFLGFHAIGRLKIEQKAGACGLGLSDPRNGNADRPTPAEVARVRDGIAGLPDGPLKDSLARLGAAVRSRRS